MQWEQVKKPLKLSTSYYNNCNENGGLMNGSLKKILISAFVLFISAMPIYSLELDMSVDEEIRKNYNPSKLELEQLPSIPETKTSAPSLPSLQELPDSISVPDKNYTPPSTLPSTPPKSTITIEQSHSTGRVKKSLPDTSIRNDITAIKIKKGTKFKVKSQTKVSDWNSAGAGMTFVSTELVTQRYLTIPAGTVFKGIIEESHPPQASGNGGLLVLKATSIQYNGKTYDINAKITKANSKKIFFNNIKGERKYWKNVAAQIDKGENFYKKTRKASTKLAENPVGVIISPIPTITGVVVYALNFAGSPLLAIASKGGHITLPAGTMYEIKLLEDAYIY